MGIHRRAQISASRGRVPWTDAAKGAAILMVVAYHATLYLQSEGVDTVLGRAKAVFELFPMPVFFLIAGLFAGRQAQFSFVDLWRRRLLPLLWLYVLWSVIRTLFYLAVPGLNGELGELRATDPRALPLILFWPSSSYWFLYALFLFTALRWVIARLPIWLQLAGAAVVSTLFTSGAVNAHNIGWNRVGGLFFFFVLGAVGARRIRAVVSRSGWPPVLGALAVLLAVTGLILAGLRWVPVVVLAGQLAAVAVGCLLAGRGGRLRPLGFLGSLGASSLKIYLLHLYFIVPASALIGLLEPRTWPRAVAAAVQLALVVATVAGSLALARLTSRVRWLYAPPAFLRGPRRRPRDRTAVPTPRPEDAGPGRESAVPVPDPVDLRPEPDAVPSHRDERSRP